MSIYFMILTMTILLTATFAGAWALFEKAGQPGWATLVPIYSLVVLHQAAGKPIWWVVFNLVCPPVYAVLLFLVLLGLVNRFGKGTAHCMGLLLLPFMFFPLLGFGDARYASPGNA